MGSPSVVPWFVQRVVIGVGDLAVSNSDQTVLSTYALGSCVGLVAYDSARKVGGILHFMLPDSRISPAKAAARPAMFADTGLPRFFAQLGSFGVSAHRMQLFVAGGAKVLSGDDPFRIGARNAEATLQYLQRHGFSVSGTDLGGSFNRTLHLTLATGQVVLKTPHGENQHNLNQGMNRQTVPI